MDRSVWWTLGRISINGKEEKIASSATAQFWYQQVRAVTVNVKYHAAAPKMHGGIGGYFPLFSITVDPAKCPPNRPVHAIAKILHNVMGSATETVLELNSVDVHNQSTDSTPH